MRAKAISLRLVAIYCLCVDLALLMIADDNDFLCAN